MPATDLEPGLLTDLKMQPTDYRVQVTTDIIVSFTTAHTLRENAGVMVRPPPGLTIPGYTDQADFTVEAILPTGETV